MPSSVRPNDKAHRATVRLRNWFRADALPLWLGAGYDEASGAFWEHLNFQAEPIHGVPRRLTVQGRQIFTYARATQLGWIDGREKVETAFESMLTRYRSPDGAPGYVFTVDDRGGVIDGNRDFYAHAFVVLAASAYFRLTGDSQAVGVADETIAFLDDALTSATGGYRDKFPNAPERLRQNPHMHLFEALLALYGATGEARYLARAGEIFGYFRTRFFQAGADILAEFFDAAWTPMGADLTVWEPGHHFEWAWLLAEYQGATGTPTRWLGDRLIASAYARGVFPPCRIVDEIRGDGLVLKGGCRTWPLTEAIKAQAVRLNDGDPDAETRFVDAVDWMMERHLSGCSAGLWLDQFSAEGVLVPGYVPASTLYHIAMAVFVADSACPNAG